MATIFLASVNRSATHANEQLALRCARRVCRHHIDARRTIIIFVTDADVTVDKRVPHAPDHIGVALQCAARDNVYAARPNQVEFAGPRFDEISAVKRSRR